jgi:hypothetical protein
VLRDARGEAPDDSTSRAIYLDMNVWVEMARGCADSKPAWLRIRDQLIRGVSEGEIVVPLSPAHYLELWHRRDHDSRRDVAKLMRDVTGYVSIPSPHVVRQHEARELVESWMGDGAALGKADLIGRGAAHAFGRPDGRLRFVESIATADGVPEGPAVQAGSDYASTPTGSGFSYSD